MKHIALTLGLLLLAAAQASAQQLTGIEIVEHGIYTTDVTKSRTEANGVVSQTVTNARLALSTTTVPLQRHVEFGFRYHLTGAPDGGSVQLRKIVVFPLGGLTPPGKPTLTQDAQTLDRTIGETRYAGYSLDEPFEMLLGKWTFQLWWGNRKLAEQSFTVVAQ